MARRVVTLVSDMATGFGEFILPLVVVNSAIKIGGPGWFCLKLVLSHIGYNVMLEPNLKWCM